MWVFYALLSSVFAALVAIFAKLGLKELDPTLATAVRSIIMALFLVIASLFLGKFRGFYFGTLNSREWLLILLAGIAGALSWLFYFFALKIGQASPVVAIDRLSLAFVIVLAAIFLGETLTWKSLLGVLCMIVGALLISL